MSGENFVGIYRTKVLWIFYDSFLNSLLIFWRATAMLQESLATLLFVCL